MDAIEYLKIRKKMCDEYNCDGCVLDIDDGCLSLEHNFPEKAIEIVQKWGDDYKEPTRQDKIFEAYPHAKVVYGVLDACPIPFGGQCHGDETCMECKRKFWTVPESGDN